MKSLIGEKFGRLTVLEYSHANTHREPFWVCRCDCGTIKTVIGASLKNGHTQSCGCFRREEAIKRATKHGMNYTRIHIVWTAMKERCENPNHKHYKHYGGRGITVCDEWRKDFVAFKDWAYANGYDENAPKGQCTLDRIDVNKNYSPDNCRWVSMAEQAKNKRKKSNLKNGEMHE